MATRLRGTGLALTRHVLRRLRRRRPARWSPAFWPFGDEFDFRPLLHALHERGHPIVLPVTPKRATR